MQTIPVLGGRYRLGPEIGSGGMGAVHRAWDERFEREVAIKLVRSDADGVERERLRREAQYLASLDHPNLVAVLDAGEDRLRHRDTVWFAMELVSGPDLRTLLRQDGALGGAAVRRILVGLLAALQVLHTAGVVHRDLKPGNVLLTAEPAADARWNVKLVDLGIAYHDRTDHLTGTGQILGTAAYLSPEQVGGAPLGPATDVYALGLLVLEALTGRIAFPGGPAESAAARLVRAPEPPASIDPAWRELLVGMTALDPELRPSVPLLLQLARALPDAALRTDRQLASLELSPTEAMPIVTSGPRTAVLTRPAERTMALPVVASAARQRRPRRRLLATTCVLVVLAAAGGGFAAVAGIAQPHAAAATSHPAVTGTARPRSPVPSASPKVHAAAKRVTPPATPTVATPSPSLVHRPAARAEGDLRRLVDRIERRFRQHHHH